MNTIIYYRKSTDRDDKQANSLEHQLNNCKTTVGRFWLEIKHELGESRSAKTEFTREKFNEMIKICKTGEIDYIVADEPKRLSRNNIDTSRIIDLMDKDLIKWVITTSREYYTEHPRDKFFLQFDLALSKMDNEDRAKDIKAKMLTALSKWKWMWHAPDGYKNVVIKKWHKEVHIDPVVWPYIQKMFRLRCEWYSPVRISEILFEDGFVNTKWNPVNHQQIGQKLENKFYMWIMCWGWEEYEWNHTPLVSKSVFYKANNIVAKRRLTKRHLKYDLSGLLYDTDGVPMRWYTTKHNIYYKQGARSKYRINIAEYKVVEQAHKIFKDCEFPENFKKINLKMIENIFSGLQKKDEVNKHEITQNINTLRARKDKLVDSFLDGDIEKSFYKQKLAKIEIEIAENEDKISKKVWISKDKLKRLKEKAELVFSLYSRESELDMPERLKILSSLKAELFISTKKELQIAESKILSTLKLLCNPLWCTQ